MKCILKNSLLLNRHLLKGITFRLKILNSSHYDKLEALGQYTNITPTRRAEFNILNTNVLICFSVVINTQ